MVSAYPSRQIDLATSKRRQLSSPLARARIQIGKGGAVPSGFAPDTPSRVIASPVGLAARSGGADCSQPLAHQTLRRPFGIGQFWRRGLGDRWTPWRCEGRFDPSVTTTALAALSPARTPFG